MSTTDGYLTRIKQVQETFSSISEARARDAKAILNLFPTPGSGLLNTSDAIDQNRRIAKRFVDVNIEYVQDVAAAVRKHMTGLASVLKDEMLTTGKLANQQAERLEEAAVEQADQIQRAEAAAARRAKRAARDAAAERYREMTKVELSEELASRDLPKTGNVDELRERLIEDDLQDA